MQKNQLILSVKDLNIKFNLRGSAALYGTKPHPGLW